MPVVSSTYAIDAHTQANGGHYVREVHTDNTGRVHEAFYLLPSGQGATEAQAFLDARAASLDVQLAEAEAEALIGS